MNIYLYVCVSIYSSADAYLADYCLVGPECEATSHVTNASSPQTFAPHLHAPITDATRNNTVRTRTCDARHAPFMPKLK